MYTSRFYVQLQKRSRYQIEFQCYYIKTTPYKAQSSGQSRISEDENVNSARSYCSNLIRFELNGPISGLRLIYNSKFDSPAYILQTFIPRSARDAYLAIRALNVELARIPDLISNPTVGTLRMQFWRDNINNAFQGTPPNEPVATLLSFALRLLRSRNPEFQTNMMKAWFLKLISAREQYMDNRPYVDMDALEKYAENTYSSILYIILAALPVHSTFVEHVASHIGKATGISAVLRGLPIIAFPPPPNHHSNNAVFKAALGSKADGRREAVVLPLDIMTKTGVKEEEVFRQGSSASGLKDAVFIVATRANDHLITAGEMLKKVKLGQDLDHLYMKGHSPTKSNVDSNSIMHETNKSFGVFLHAVSTRLWLQRLEKLDFDIFRPELRTLDWRLPWKTYWAYSRRLI